MHHRIARGRLRRPREKRQPLIQQACALLRLLLFARGLYGDGSGVVVNGRERHVGGERNKQGQSALAFSQPPESESRVEGRFGIMRLALLYAREVFGRALPILLLQIEMPQLKGRLRVDSARV